MNTIQNLFQQAQLAEAAYANFFDAFGNLITSDDGVKAALIVSGFSIDPNNPTQSAQAAAFITQWRVVDQYTASGGLLGQGSGFSGTLFQNIQTGKYQFSLRGTEPGATDLSADIGDIVADGLALDQIVEMYNYWQSLTHTGVYQAAKLQTSLIETAALNLLPPGLARNAYIAVLRAGGAIIDDGLPVTEVRYVTTNNNSNTLLAGTPLALGSGKLGATASVNVDGHSLGGHLAMAFSRLFPSATADVVAVNGAGFDYADPNVNILFSKLGGAPGFDAGKITNVVGSAAMNLVSQDWLFLQQPAGRNEIYTESYLPGTGTTIGHGSSQMTDSLAVYNLFATLDPSLNTTSADSIGKITNLLKASSNTAANTLEYTLDALRTLLQTDYTMGSANFLAQPATTIDDRQSLYANLQSLQSFLANSAFNLNPGNISVPQYAFNLHTLGEAAHLSANTIPTAEALAAVAKTDLATRYALYQGNTFVLDATGYDLYTTINTSGALNLYDPTQHTGQLTDQYLKDRAAFVLAKARANTDDHSNYEGPVNGSFAWVSQSGEDVIYLDKLGNGLPDYATAKIYQGNKNLQDVSLNNVKQIQFGSLLSDTLTGGNKEDHLYGMGGNDTLTGGKGNDYLEGGKGQDTYRYTNGGNNQDGLDTLLDTDGQGSIVVDGNTLAGGAQYGDTRVFKSPEGSTDGQHRYVYVTGNAIDGGDVMMDNSILIKNVTGHALGSAGDLSLTLTGPAAEASLTALTGNDSANFIGSAIYDKNPGNSSVLQANLSGGSAHPADLSGSAAANILEGGAGSDIISGGAGSDRLYADTQIAVATAISEGNPSSGPSGSGLKGDWLAGGSGDDTVVGSAGNDVLTGGGGSDLLIGGTGDDDILGDSGWVAGTFDWTVTNDANGSRLFTGASGDPLPADAGADVIYAGAGNDHVWAGQGNDVLFGEDGNDELSGNGGNDIILGGVGDDLIQGDAIELAGITATNEGNDYLDGGDNNDTIYGNGGDDILIGGMGADTLTGGVGRDTYIFNKGDGIDTVYDDLTPGANTFKFGAGVNAADIKLRKGSLLLDLGNGDAIHIEGFDSQDALNSSSISSFEFDDGSVLSVSDLLARGFDLDGTAGDDTLFFRERSEAANDKRYEAERRVA